jgi:uncharacterized protein
MVVDYNNKFITQRTVPIMSLIQPTITTNDTNEDDFLLKLEAKDMEDVVVDMSRARTNTLFRFEGTVWGQSIPSFEPSEEASRWFSRITGKSVRLVAMDTSYRREISPELLQYGGDGEKSDNSYADLFSFHIISWQSLEALNQKLVAAGHNAITVRNFRPNIVFDGVEAFTEDDWYDIEFYRGATDSNEKSVMNMRVMKPRARCNIPTVDDSTGQYNAAAQPTKMFKTFRSGTELGFKKTTWQGSVFFGLDVDHFGQEGGSIRVGDGLKVLSSQQRWY